MENPAYIYIYHGFPQLLRIWVGSSKCDEGDLSQCMRGAWAGGAVGEGGGLEVVLENTVKECIFLSGFRL